MIQTSRTPGRTMSAEGSREDQNYSKVSHSPLAHGPPVLRIAASAQALYAIIRSGMTSARPARPSFP